VGNPNIGQDTFGIHTMQSGQWPMRDKRLKCKGHGRQLRPMGLLSNVVRVSLVGLCRYRGSFKLRGIPFST